MSPIRHVPQPTARHLTRVLACALFLAIVVISPVPAAAAPPPTPPFGPQIDPYPSADPPPGCNSPGAKPGVVAFRDMLVAAYPFVQGEHGITRECTGSTSEHWEGRALDWSTDVTVPAERAAAEEVLAWLLATDEHGNPHARLRRLGIIYMIWNEEIWSVERRGEGWRQYPCDGTASDCHRNHVHFSFGWAGARQETSWWRPPAPAGSGSVAANQAVVFGAEQHYFARNPGGGLSHTWWAPGVGTLRDVWGTDQVLGRPVAFGFGNQQHAFARGADNTLRHWYWWPGVAGNLPVMDTWNTAGRVTSDPAAFVAGREQHVFYRAPDGSLDHRWYDDVSGRLYGDNWGGAFTGNPVAYTFGAEQHVFARGTDSSLQHWYWFPGIAANLPARDSWAGAGQVASDPTGFTTGQQQHVFYRAADGTIGHRFYDANLRLVLGDNWGEQIRGTPLAFTFGNQQHVFARGTDNSLRHVFWFPGAPGNLPVRDAWSGPGRMTSDPAGFVTAVEQHVFYRAPDAGIGHHWWNADAAVLFSDTWPGPVS